MHPSISPGNQIIASQPRDGYTTPDRPLARRLLYDERSDAEMDEEDASQSTSRADEGQSHPSHSILPEGITQRQVRIFHDRFIQSQTNYLRDVFNRHSAAFNRDVAEILCHLFFLQDLEGDTTDEDSSGNEEDD